MATLDEKRSALVALLEGDEVLADSVLKQVATKEAEADAQRLAFKEAAAPAADPPTLFTDKAKAAEADDEADEADEADEDTEDGEDGEDGEDFDEDAEDGEDFDEDEDTKEFDTPQFLGDVPASVFYDRLAEALSQVLYPIITQVKELNDSVSKTLKERSVSESKAASEAAALKEKLDAQEKELGKLRKTVKGMQADIPTGARQFLASQADDSLISEDRAKELGAPSPDPLSDFAAFAFGKQ